MAQVPEDDLVGQGIKQVIRPVGQIAVVLADALPDAIDIRQHIVMVGDQVIRPEEGVELVRRERVLGLRVVLDGMDRQVKVVAPVVELGHVRFLQRVVDGQGVEAEDLEQDRLTRLGRFAGEIQPDHSRRLSQQTGELGRRDILADPAVAVAVEETDHRRSA